VTSATRSDGKPAAVGVASETWTLLQDLVLSHRPRWMAVIREYDLIPPHWIALQMLEEPKPMGALAKRLACDNSNVTWITDRLEERGLVTRTQAPHDRRVRLLALTPEGQRLRDGINARLAEPPQAIAELPAADQRKLRDLLRRVTQSMQAEPA
jgi:DNA-binding MarR family transcriptional regulator